MKTNIDLATNTLTIDDVVYDIKKNEELYPIGSIVAHEGVTFALVVAHDVPCGDYELKWITLEKFNGSSGAADHTQLTLISKPLN